MSNENFSEKVSVNINASTLSSIDLLVDNSYYSNRSDFINQALREGLQKHQSTIDRIIDKKTESNSESSNQWFVGVYSLDKQDIERALQREENLKLRDTVFLLSRTILRKSPCLGSFARSTSREKSCAKRASRSTTA